MNDDLPVQVLTGDLFFRARIEATASAVGVPVAFARSAEELLDRLDADQGNGPEASMVLVDLSDRAIDHPAIIRALKARPCAPAVVAFGSHVDRESLRGARAAGADQVMARSTFTERLPQLLRGAGA
jgi:CheY-like chemotaxis protein